MMSKTTIENRLVWECEECGLMNTIHHPQPAVGTCNVCGAMTDLTADTLPFSEHTLERINEMQRCLDAGDETSIRRLVRAAGESAPMALVVRLGQVIVNDLRVEIARDAESN